MISLSDGAKCTHSSCVANLLYTSELVITNRVSSTQCRAVNIHSERLIETSLSDGVDRTHVRCLANLLYRFSLIVINGVYFTECEDIINGVYSAQCRVVNIQSE